jgi:hypothetical protein
MTGRRLRTRSIALSATFATIVAGAVAACSSNNSDEPDDTNTFYCVDEESVIVPERFCEDDRDNKHYIAYGAFPVGLLIGHRLASGWRFPARDTAARASWGLPTSRGFTNGTVKTGIIGTTGSSISSGSGS